MGSGSRSAGCASPWRRRRGSAGRCRAGSGSIANGRPCNCCRTRGVAVPRPIARTEDAILMSYVGDEDDPAPQLCSSRLDRAEAENLFAQLRREIELMLLHNVVHGDSFAVHRTSLEWTSYGNRSPAGGRPAEESACADAARARRS
ncbi:MAG: RIO1 family regulatory kinase/ATPase domain-containing protein [Actinomycetota bacterium]